MCYYVYILQSQVDFSFYIGYSANPAARLERHNSGRSRYTSRKSPWKIVFTEEFALKTDALERERFLKKQRNREFYLKLIASKTY
jgi:putative endonuclease